MLTERQKGQRRAAYAANPRPQIERSKVWAKNNSEKRKAIALAWYYKHKDQQLIYSRAYRKTERGQAKSREANNRRRIDNPDLWAINMAKKALCRRTGLSAEHLDASIIEAEVARLSVLTLCRNLSTPDTGRK